MSISSLKEFYIQWNIGTAKYIVNYCDGVKKHKDGSIQHDIKIFTSQKKMNEFVKKLRSEGYEEVL